MCAVAACSHTCHATPRGPACACPAPLRLQSDGYSCGTGARACAEWGVCSQTCTEHKGRARCTCLPGYRLAGDAFTCKSTAPERPLLVYSTRHELRAVDLTDERHTSRALVSSLRNTIALAWRRAPAPPAPPAAVHVYWADVLDDAIYRGTLLGDGELSVVYY